MLPIIVSQNLVDYIYESNKDSTDIEQKEPQETFIKQQTSQDIGESDEIK